jgi:hypothetical protein
MGELKMTLEEMISTLDGAAGRLIVAAMRDPVIREAHEMIMKVSLALGEVDELIYSEYGEYLDYEEES